MRGASFLPASLLLVVVAACGGTSTSTATAPGVLRCPLDASANPSNFPPSGGTGSLSINTTRDCGWAVIASADWISISTPREGQGEGRVTYAVARNTIQEQRRGSIEVNGSRVELVQAAAPPPPPPQPPPPPPPPPAPAPPPAPQPGPAPAPPAPAPPPPAPAPQPAPPAPAPQPNPAPPAPPPPAPAPTPPLPPPPDDGDDEDDDNVGKALEVDGRVESLGGSCPNLTMTVDRTRVVTDRGTEFKKLECSELRNGRQVNVKGRRRADGALLAERIEED